MPNEQDTPYVLAGTGVMGTLIASTRAANQSSLGSIGTDLVLRECVQRLAPTQPPVADLARRLKEYDRDGEKAAMDQDRETGPGSTAVPRDDVEIEVIACDVRQFRCACGCFSESPCCRMPRCGQ